MKQEGNSSLIMFNIHNYKRVVTGILWLSNKIPNKKLEDPTEILARNFLFMTWIIMWLVNWFREQWR